MLDIDDISKNINSALLILDDIFLQQTAFSLVKSRFALGSPGCRLVVTMPKMAQYREKMVFDCPIMITSKVKPFSRPQKTRKEE